MYKKIYITTKEVDKPYNLIKNKLRGVDYSYIKESSLTEVHLLAPIKRFVIFLNETKIENLQILKKLLDSNNHVFIVDISPENDNNSRDPIKARCLEYPEDCLEESLDFFIKDMNKLTLTERVFVPVSSVDAVLAISNEVGDFITYCKEETNKYIFSEEELKALFKKVIWAADWDKVIHNFFNNDENFYCHDECCANAQEDYDFKKCSTQCDKCKED